MSPLFSFSLITLLSFSPITVQSQPSINSSQPLDLLIRDYTFKSYDSHLSTSTVQTIKLPANISGIQVNSAKFRCGSLRRYGAQIKEFHLGIGVIIQPCVERVMVITQNLGLNWSLTYSSNYGLKGYKLVSPILGLLAYNAGTDKSFNLSNTFELEIGSRENPIAIDFKNLTFNLNSSRTKPICARFEENGKLTLIDQESASNFVCVTTKGGHYGLVGKPPQEMGVSPPAAAEVKGKISVWKVVVGCTVGSGLGLFLLCLLMVAMFVKVKKKAKMEEMERRAYEEEALQVSMVGHVRAPTATVTRTLPTIEHEYKPSYYAY